MLFNNLQLETFRHVASKMNYTLLMFFIQKETHFPHGSLIIARCKQFGLYKLKGDNALHCENGDWAPKFPECVPTTVVTNFTGLLICSINM